LNSKELKPKKGNDPGTIWEAQPVAV